MSAQHEVLLVDEDAEFVRSTRELLEARGYDVITATTGESGFQKVLKYRPDLLVLDVAVAGKTVAFEAAQRVPATVELRTMPVLLVAAALSPPATPLEADKTWLPVGSILSKPIDPAAFVAAVGDLLRRRREMSQNMGILNTVKDMLAGKENALWTVAPDASVRQAAETMERYRVRALPVVEKGRLLGIVTDRDLVRKIILEHKPGATLVRDIMTTKLICVSPQQSLEECMSIITHKRIRHLPVMEGDRLLGIVSVGDVVRMVLESKNLAIEQLSTYITSG